MTTRIESEHPGELIPNNVRLDSPTQPQHRAVGRLPTRYNHLPKVLVIACGALAREFLAVVDANGWHHMEITCLPAEWHFTPKKIPEGIRGKIRENRSKYDEILCLFGDCGTGGELDEVLQEEGVRRIAGDHCYAFFAGIEEFDAMHAEESGTLYLTDFLVRHFDTFVIRYLGLDLYPELRDDYFGNFTRVMYLTQISDPELEAKARAAAQRLGLRLEVHRTGLAGIETFLSGSIVKFDPPVLRLPSRTLTDDADRC
jgi:hypothetical protein